MAEKPSNASKSKPIPATRPSDVSGDRIPTNEELLRDLWRPDAKSKGPREIPAVSRRTRDFLLLAGIGSVVIVAASFKVMSGSETMVILRLALTGVTLLCGLLWFIFYGVMGRY